MACPPTAAVSVDAVFVKNVLSGLTAKGVDCTPWFGKAGIDPEQLQSGGSVTLHQMATLVRAAIEETDDELLGLTARPARRGSFALQVRAALGATDLGAAIRRAAHVFRLLHDDVQLHAVEDEGLIGVVLRCRAPTALVNPHLHELLLRVYWRLFAWLVGGRLPPHRFDFAYARPPYAVGYGPIYPAPWRFDAGESAMWFDAEHRRLPVCRDEAALRVFMTNGAINLLLPSRDHGLAGRVRVYLQQARPSWPSLAAAARALHMSPSALQRHLAAEGTSYRALRDHLRRDAAIYRLRTSELPLIKVALELGFTDASTFQRAFKGWTGLPPGAYRRPQGPIPEPKR